ncbi:hypothetical protein ACI48D_07515 [Massilia sp. LXY-6]|uniref:hypothetical protein n=1 Tax=Massilia sp. LXY-6 TaxID=3379823 RepID=UPI003EE2086A
MNDLTPSRKYAIAAVCGIFAVSLLYQIVKGWDIVEFLLRGTISTAGACLLWRSAGMVSRGYAGSGAGRRLALHGLCWAVVAAVLFLGFGLSG